MDTEQAVEKAILFLEEKAGMYTHKLISVDYDENEAKWHIHFDTGFFAERIIRIIIDDKTERVVKYERP